jgi:hypothetical protein
MKELTCKAIKEWWAYNSTVLNDGEGIHEKMLHMIQMRETEGKGVRAIA